MSVRQLIFRNLRHNLKNYYLYIFALIFSVALYFAFVTLQFDPAMDEAKGSIKGAAAIRTASVVLIAIVAVFLLYANTIFIKRRSKEIGLLQLIGMRKKRIFRILSAENMVLYFSATIIGTFLGFSGSKVITMILFKVTKVETSATLNFSWQAFIQTVIVFTIIYLFIMIMNYLFIKKHSILSLFKVQGSSEYHVKKISILEMMIGVIGIILIMSGYYLSSKLFGGTFTSMDELFFAMIAILAAVIIGTYLFYKGSVSFIMNLIRRKKAGYLTISDVLSLSSLMFKMKSNALLLTVITTVSALAIGLLSLSYISYYSAEKSAENYVIADFSITNEKDANKFKEALDANDIPYSDTITDVIQADVNLVQILDTIEEVNFDPKQFPLPIVSDEQVKSVNIVSEEAIFTGYTSTLEGFLTFKDRGDIELLAKENVIPLHYVGMKDESVIPLYFTNGGLPAIIVDESVFEALRNNLDEAIQKESSTNVGIDISNPADLEEANELFNELYEEFTATSPHTSQLDLSDEQKRSMGLMMFIVGFLGLTFLITSGCILYFKQMDQSEEEKPNYTILRKLGFTRYDLLQGIKRKQLFNFGIPLLIGLLHSYFAVQSGWFFFGTELWTPMIIVMVLYTILYSVFGLLSVSYYKKVIKDAL
ncbi:ABC transporter permease [Oceanobacillus halotolerans]|uniref:ABC transporter permease n=1 Tax=Oceanobacillus halotolerans TaxID=2663380 RepID=UPI0013DD7253|nr:ABC transporter permease [Oceanobacillus halotolerans]